MEIQKGHDGVAVIPQKGNFGFVNVLEGLSNCNVTWRNLYYICAVNSIVS